MKYLFSFFLFSSSSWLVPVHAENRSPSILFCALRGPVGYADLTYLKELAEKGFQVDYTNRMDDITAERIRNYNVIILFQEPGARKAKPSDPAPQAFVSMIREYVAKGGGAFLMPTEQNIGRQKLYDLTQLFGAKLPVEIIVEPDRSRQGRLSHVARMVPLAYTDQVLPSPVSRGIRGIWYPTAKSYNAQHTGPILVDDSWTAVVRGSKTSKTEPVDLSKSGFRELHDPFIRQEGAPQPELFAIRQYQQGRVALMNQWCQYSIGSGTKWIFNRQVLSRGVGDRPSDFGPLLENTFRWLAEPSLENKAVGGFTMAPETLVPPNRREHARNWFKYNFWYWEYETAQWHRPPKYAPVFKGLIGAKTVFSSGQGTVKEYAAAAKRAGLDFVIFLEDFDRLTKPEFESLSQECLAHSGAKLKLFPGYTLETNIGDHLFVCGPGLGWPPDYCLTGPGKKLFDLQPQNADGTYKGLNGPSFNWLLSHSREHQVGYFNFADRGQGMRMEDLRCYSMVGLRYYRRGQFIEDMTNDYLRTAEGTLGPTPASLNEVFSPAELAEEVRKGNALTYAQARNLDLVFPKALRWAHQYDGLNVFSSDGPIIHAWPYCHRAMTLGSENFVTPVSIMPSRILITSDKGLKEIRIYNGQELYRRFLLNGEKRFEQTLVLEGIVHKNLVLIAEDRAGGKAVSSTRRSWKCGGRQVVFCGDHVNDCKSGGFILGRGPNPMIAHWVMPLAPQFGGYTWDGGPPANLPLITFAESRPNLDSDKGKENGTRFEQTPLSEFSDGGALGATSEQEIVFADSVKRVANPWNTFGPLGGPSRLMKYKLRYRELYSPTVGVPEAGWQGPGVRSGANACLFRSEITFKDSFTVKRLSLLYNFHRANVPVVVILGKAGGQVVKVFDPETLKKQLLHRLEPGDWFALFSPKESASHLFINRLKPVILQMYPLPRQGNWGVWLLADLAGKPVANGDSHVWELFSIGIPVDRPLNKVEDMTRLLQYLLAPGGLLLKRGKRVPSPGLFDCEPDRYAVEISVPKPATRTDLTLPVRIRSLNRRWSAGLYQYEGYVKGDHGKGENRYRPLGLDIYGNAYVPLYVDLAPQTHIIAGHPVIADERGKDLFIQVTHVYENPHQWHVAVNNPTDKPIRTTFRATMPLPNLVVPDGEITIGPGQHKVLR